MGESALPAGTFGGVSVVVTGGGTGLGKAIATEFARLGAAIVIASRKEEHLAAGRDAMEAIGAPVSAVRCDIRQPDEISAAFDSAEAGVGPPGGLVNKSAPHLPRPGQGLSPDPWPARGDLTPHAAVPCARGF